MKKPLIAALVASQVAAAPVLAENYAPVRDTETGTFAGLRLHMSFGGETREPLRAGLAFAPVARADYQDGRVRTRIGEGLEFGINGRGPMRFSLAGMPANQLVQGRTGPDGRRMGVSTLGWVAIGVGATVVVLFAAAAICFSDHDCLPDD